MTTLILILGLFCLILGLFCLILGLFCHLLGLYLVRYTGNRAFHCDNTQSKRTHSIVREHILTDLDRYTGNRAFHCDNTPTCATPQSRAAVCTSVKRALFMCQKSPIRVAKETYSHARHLNLGLRYAHKCQKSPIHVLKRALFMCPKRPIHVSNETYSCGKRNKCQESPMHVAKET